MADEQGETRSRSTSGCLSYCADARRRQAFAAASTKPTPTRPLISADAGLESRHQTQQFETFGAHVLYEGERRPVGEGGSTGGSSEYSLAGDNADVSVSVSPAPDRTAEPGAALKVTHFTLDAKVLFSSRVPVSVHWVQK